jgi:cbb3-type cytochrome oxidase subunit 3
MHHLFPVFALMGSIVPYTYLLQAAIFFILLVAAILLFVVVYLYRQRKRQQKKQALRLLYSDLIAEMTLCESEEERRTTLHQFLAQNTGTIKVPFSRNVLIREIVKAKDSISGGAADNLRWLYETLDLDKDTLQRFASEKWHRKASAIQHLAEMQQSSHLVKIYRETNNRHSLIRTEAQLAVVKLTGFKGLRFLNIVSYPVSQWQQLSLISRLQEDEAEEESIRIWLQSKNETVVEFALRLCQVYKCFNLHDAAAECLKHASATVRLQALVALKEISNSSTTRILLSHFRAATKEEQLMILDMLSQLDGARQQLVFLTSLLQHPEEAVRYKSLQLVRQFSPAWSSVVIRQLKNEPMDTPLLLSPEKEAV